MILWLDFTIVALHTFPVEVAIIRKIKTVYTTPTQKLYFIELSILPHAIIHITSSWLCYDLATYRLCSLLAGFLVHLHNTRVNLVCKYFCHLQYILGL